MKLSYCVQECLGYEIYNVGEMHPVMQQMFETTSKIILIRQLVQWRGNSPPFALEDCNRREEQNKMHVPTFGKLVTYATSCANVIYDDCSYPITVLRHPQSRNQ
jgi:hypothetical protein